MLSRTLDGALRQEKVGLEVVVVDDASRDETFERLRQLSDGRVRVVRRDRSEGVAAARNRGLAEVRGEWVAFLDDDDLWSPRKLSAQLDAINVSRADFAYTGVVVVDERAAPFYAPPLPAPETLAEELLAANVMPAGSSNVLARTELVRAVGGLDERFSELDDWDMWLRLAHRGRAASCPEVLVAYVEHSDNMPAVNRQDLHRELELLVSKHAAAAPPILLEPDRLDFLRWVARGHGRAGRRLKAGSLYLSAAARYHSPPDALRAVRVLVAGQPARFWPRVAGDPATDPEWLGAYR